MDPQSRRLGLGNKTRQRDKAYCQQIPYKHTKSSTWETQTAHKQHTNVTHCGM